jgi:hypothetical protein
MTGRGGASEKRPVVGMMPHMGELSIPMVEAGLQPTLSPLMPSTVAVESLRSTNDDDRFSRRHA